MAKATKGTYYGYDHVSSKWRRFEVLLKDRWKARLEQIETWMISYRIEIE